MKKEDLMKFCGGQYPEPWTRDGYTYACNGHILCRIPSINDIANTNGPDVNLVEQKTPQPERYIALRDCTLPMERWRGIINGVSFRIKYLRLLAKLPGCEIGPNKWTTTDRSKIPPSRFRFEGGDGLIMPLIEER